MNEKRIEIARLKFHNILIILQLLVELVVYGGHLNESSVCKKNKNGYTWIYPFQEGHNSIGL